MPGYLLVRNWDEFQHYKDRSPPWIKLHRSLLNNYEFQCLQDASKAHLMGIWLLASQLDNKVPADAAWIGQRIAATTPVDLSALIDSGFLVFDGVEQTASMALAKCSPETETETETETDKKARKRAAFVRPTVEQVAEYVKERGSPVDPEAFVAFYESKGWKVGTAPMRNWKQAIITWEKRSETTDRTARDAVFEQPHERRARELAEAVSRAEGAPGVGEASGDIRGQVYEGVWERSE